MRPLPPSRNSGMRITIVVDANPIMAALLGGTARAILFDRRFRFITTKFTIQEIKSYIPILAEKTRISANDIREAISLIPVEIYDETFYQGSIIEAKMLIGPRDPKDADILALVLKTKAPLWSNDLDFEGLKGVTLLKTKDLI